MFNVTDFKSSEQFGEEDRILISKYKQINLIAFLLKYNEIGRKIRLPEYVITNAQETCIVIFRYESLTKCIPKSCELSTYKTKALDFRRMTEISSHE